MKVLFTHSYFLNRDAKQQRAGRPYPPLATLYAMAFLRKKGYEVCLADLQFGQPEQLRNFITKEKPDILVVYDDSFNYLVKMCLTNMREAVFSMLSIAKEFNLPVVVSSSDATDHKQEYLNNGAAFLIIGEAEQTLYELLDSITNNTSPESVKGIAYYKSNLLFETSNRNVLKSLDELPMPAWDLIDLEPYRKLWLKNAGYFSINMVTTRGCPYKCNWCAKPVYGNRYNSHSAERVVQELEYLITTKSIQHVWFADDIFGLKPGFLEAFASALKMKGIKLPFKIQSRADLLCNETSVQWLAEAGCDEIWIGAESGSQRILDAMDKGTTIKQIEEVSKLVQKYKMRIAFFMQFGYSGENIDDIYSSIHLLERLKPDDIGVSVSYPLPGTVFYERVKNEMKEKQNWSDSDDLQLMFNSTYLPEFYKVLQKYVHYRFRRIKATEALKAGKFNRAVALLPYYSLQQIAFKRKLNTKLKSTN